MRALVYFCYRVCLQPCKGTLSYIQSFPFLCSFWCKINHLWLSPITKSNTLFWYLELFFFLWMRQTSIQQHGKLAHQFNLINYLRTEGILRKIPKMKHLSPNCLNQNANGTIWMLVSRASQWVPMLRGFDKLPEFSSFLFTLWWPNRPPLIVYSTSIPLNFQSE
jgi:hypothetical protein